VDPFVKAESVSELSTGGHALRLCAVRRRGGHTQREDDHDHAEEDDEEDLLEQQGIRAGQGAQGAWQPPHRHLVSAPLPLAALASSLVACLLLNGRRFTPRRQVSAPVRSLRAGLRHLRLRQNDLRLASTVIVRLREEAAKDRPHRAALCDQGGGLDGQAPARVAEAEHQRIRPARSATIDGEHIGGGQVVDPGIRSATVRASVISRKST